MIYSVPVNDAHEVLALAAACAGELYCSLQEPWWIERYGDHDSISRRQGRANLGSREALAATVSTAREHGLPLYLALNGQYDERQLDYLVDLAESFEDMGGTGLIVRDMGLLFRLQERGSDLKRVCSLLAVCANAPSVLAYARLGVSRVVFPRFLGASEIGGILRACACEGVDVEGESMVFFDKCPLVDGYCTHYHGVSYPDRVGADAQLPGDPLYTFDTTYRTHACLGRSCEYLEPYPCAACDLARLEHHGVRFGKVGGRGRPLEERIRALEFLRAAEDLAGDIERRQLYRQTFSRSCACYYGKATQNRLAIEPVMPDVDDSCTFVGDMRDGSKLRSAIVELRAAHGPVTLLVGPLPQSELEPERWERTVQLLCEALTSCKCDSIDVCANDMGALVALSRVYTRMAESFGAGGRNRLAIVAGPLLTRGDALAELEHFLSPAENPSRPVWDLEGMPRTLTYQRPPQSLLDHWNRLMRFDARTSYQRALEYVAPNIGARHH